MNESAINQFIGKSWEYKKNDCWSVFREASKAIFNIHVKEICIPEKSSMEANSALFEHYSKGSHWREVEGPQPGRAAYIMCRENEPHIGLCISNNEILHCPGSMSKAGTTAVHRIDVLKKVYKSIKYYEYSQNSSN